MPKRHPGIKAASTVYFIEAVGFGLIKIGFTARPMRRRFGALSAASPVLLAVLGVMPGHVGTERGLHGRFRHLWDHAEWFRDDAELREFIAANTEHWSPVRGITPRPITSLAPKRQTVAEWGETTQLTYKSHTKTAAEWCRIAGRPLAGLKWQLARGQSFDEIAVDWTCRYFFEAVGEWPLLPSGVRA